MREMYKKETGFDPAKSEDEIAKELFDVVSDKIEDHFSKFTFQHSNPKQIEVFDIINAAVEKEFGTTRVEILTQYAKHKDFLKCYETVERRFISREEQADIDKTTVGGW